MTQETMEKGAEKWVFETNGHKWSNNDDTAGDNFGSFIAGAYWQQEQAKEMEKEKMIEFANEYAQAVMGGCLLNPTEFYNETFKQQ